jgi:hypothetical protein
VTAAHHAGGDASDEAIRRESTMKTFLRSIAALAFLASTGPALAGEDQPDHGYTGIQAPRSEARGEATAVSAEIATAARAEGDRVAAAHDVAPKPDPFAALDRSTEGGG